VILVDANLLVYAHVSSTPQHKAAKEWLDEKINGSIHVGLPWPSLLAFTRLVSNPRIFEKPESIASAWKQVESWLDRDTVWVPLPTDRHREALVKLLPSTYGRANLIPDAHMAALAIEHGLTLFSTDGDFARFPDLSWQNPLRSA
jgi:toxin-antitoxin system PIN domain toxin